MQDVGSMEHYYETWKEHSSRLWCKIIPWTSVEQIKDNEGPTFIIHFWKPNSN